MKGKTWVILLGIVAGTAFTSYAIAKKGKKNKNLTSKDELKNEVNSVKKREIKDLTEAESFFV